MTNSAATHQSTISRVRTEIESVFEQVNGWFEKPSGLRAFRPSSGGWTIDEVLEHITLTSHFLLIVARKNCDKALKRAARGETCAAPSESNLDLLDPVGQWGSFRWIRPAHMEPTGSVTSEEVRRTMKAQRDECLEILSRLDRGQGALITVRMSVNDSGRLDVYQWIYFLALHARRHLTQMERNEAEFLAPPAPSGPGCPPTP